MNNYKKTTFIALLSSTRNKYIKNHKNDQKNYKKKLIYHKIILENIIFSYKFIEFIYFN
jgi:hypothetical protein